LIFRAHWVGYRLRPGKPWEKWIKGVQEFQVENQGTEHHIQASEVLPYTPAQVYALVADVERYPEFLPW